MNIEEHLLTCLAEECAEVAKEVSKALRFGLEDRDPTNDAATTQRWRIRQELNDLFAVVEILEDANILHRGLDLVALAFKKQKVRRFLDYAREKGALRD